MTYAVILVGDIMSAKITTKNHIEIIGEFCLHVDRNGLVPRAHDRVEFGDRGVSTLPPAKRPSIRMPRGKSDSARSLLHALRPLVQISGEAVHVFEQPFEALRYPCELAL